MTSGLVNASFSLPEWQAVKMIFFAPCIDLAKGGAPFNKLLIYFKQWTCNHWKEIHLEEPAISWKLVPCQWITSKKTYNLKWAIPKPATQSCDTGQWKSSFDSCKLTTTWMCNIQLQAPTWARKCEISHRFPCGAGMDAQSCDYQINDQISQLWGSTGKHPHGAPVLKVTNGIID